MATSVQEIHIRWWSKVVANTCLVGALVLPVLVLMGLHLSDPALPIWTITLGLLPVCLFSMSMVAAYRCFVLFSKGKWFSQHPAKHMRKSGVLLIWASFAGILVPTLTEALTTLNSFSLSFSSHQFQSLVFGGIIWVLGSVWQDAYLISKENAEFV